MTILTIYRRQKERNLPSYQLLHHLPLTPAHCRARLQWSLARSGWKHVDCRRIVFSDESSFQLYPDNHRKRVKRRSWQRVDPAFPLLLPTDPQPGVMV
ncbi:hypothetical protein TNCV_385501 [Trichonephila clavipes]|nr:hypothetical protein TNCV_385501 [Trichonephila clavipes]